VKVAALLDVRPRPRRVAIGTFDGVHLGHRQVIEGADTVVTFDPHPTAVIRPGAAPRLLTSLARKTTLIATLGVQELVVIAFDADFAARSAREFVDDVLVGALGASHVSVGENFRFGRAARGDTDLLLADERFRTRVVRLLEIDGEIVSSSHIRALVLGGAVEYAGRLLGDPFTLAGVVVHGDRRGRELDCPTANLVPDVAFVTPGHGVYAALARTAGGAVVPSAVSVGVRPMFETGRGELIEAHLIDFSGDLYDTHLELTFLKRLRGERRFDSIQALVDQMALDVDQARAICG